MAELLNGLKLGTLFRNNGLRCCPILEIIREFITQNRFFMEQITQFITNHWTLFLALIAILSLIFINELFAQKKRAKALSPAQVIDKINHEEAVIIDIRDIDAFRAGHIIDAVHASVDDFNEQRMDKYKTKPVIFVCARGLQSAAHAAKLRTMGFTEPMVLTGGITAWQEAKLPLVKGKN